MQKGNKAVLTDSPLSGSIREFAENICYCDAEEEGGERAIWEPLESLGDEVEWIVDDIATSLAVFLDSNRELIEMHYREKDRAAMPQYRVKQINVHIYPHHYKDGYLTYYETGKQCVYTRGHAIKKARLFGGRAELIKTDVK